MTALDGLLYMDSTSDNAGNVAITLTFASGTNPDIAQVQVQNRLQQAVPLLPQIVQQQGISVSKSQQQLSAGDRLRLRRRQHERRRHRRLSGDQRHRPGEPRRRGRRRAAVRRQVCHAHLARSRQAQCLRPDARRTSSAPFRRQNAQISVGQLGDCAVACRASSSTPPSPRSAACRRPNSSATSSCAATPMARRCGCATWRASSWGRPTTASTAQYNGKPASGMGVKLATGANALRTVRRRQGAARAACSRSFPRGLKAVHRLRHHPVRAQVDRGGGQDAARGDRCWCSW